MDLMQAVGNQTNLRRGEKHFRVIWVVILNDIYTAFQWHLFFILIFKFNSAFSFITKIARKLVQSERLYSEDFKSVSVSPSILNSTASQ